MRWTNAQTGNTADVFPVVEDSGWETSDADEGNRKRKPKLGYCSSRCRSGPTAGWEYHRPDAIGENQPGTSEGLGYSLDGIDARLTAVFDLGKAGTFSSTLRASSALVSPLSCKNCFSIAGSSCRSLLLGPLLRRDSIGEPRCRNAKRSGKLSQWCRHWDALA